MTKRIAIVLTSNGKLGDTGEATGFHVGEAAQPWAAFRAAGHEVEVLSTAGGTPPADSYDRDDELLRTFVDEHRDTIAATAADPSRYDAVYFAGGHGTMWDFPDNAALIKLARNVYERGGVVAAVCHGPAALVGLTLSDGSYLVAGKRVAVFTNSEEEAAGKTKIVPFLLATRLEEQGAKPEPAPDWRANVVRDGRLVTGQNPASAEGVAQETLNALAG